MEVNGGSFGGPLRVVDLDKFREEARIAAISESFKEAAELALSDWDTTVIVGTVGDDVHVIFPEGLTRFELLGILTAAVQEFDQRHAEGDAS
jgi:hypothetical protein